MLPPSGRDCRMRRKDREVTDIKEILRIIESAKVLRLGLFDGDYPYIVPLHYGFDFTEDTLTFYMHGAKEGHKIDLIQRDPHVCIELDCDIELVSGGDTACQYGSTYASVIGHGEIILVSDEAEKIKGLRLLMKNQTGRDFMITGQMAEAVAVMKVTIARFTAKERARQ